MVLFGQVIPASSHINHGLVVPWLTFYCVASVISILVIVLKLVLFMRQLRERQAGLDLLGSDHLEHANKLVKHRKQLTKTKRSLYLIYASIAVGIAENVPIGILQGELTSNIPSISLCACNNVSAWLFVLGYGCLHAHEHAVCCAVMYLLRVNNATKDELSLMSMLSLITTWCSHARSIDLHCAGCVQHQFNLTSSGASWACD